MTTKERERIYAFAAAICLAILVGDRLVWSPIHNVWAKRSERIAELKKSLNNGEVLVGREARITVTWDEMKKLALPPEPSLAENNLLKSVDRWVQESGLTVTSLRPQWAQPEDPNDGFAELKCYVVARGDLREISRFLYEMETDPLAIKVEDVALAARDSTGNDLSLTVRLSGLVLLEGNQ